MLLRASNRFLALKWMFVGPTCDMSGASVKYEGATAACDFRYIPDICDFPESPEGGLCL